MNQWPLPKSKLRSHPSPGAQCDATNLKLSADQDPPSVYCGAQIKETSINECEATKP